ncbi:MAG: hypothetical protein WC644_01390 [Ignavibacteria bacterium]
MKTSIMYPRALNCLTPEDCVMRRQEQKLKEREEKLLREKALGSETANVK